MNKTRKKTGKRGIALVVAVVFLVAWLGALIVTVKDRFFSAGSPASAQGRLTESSSPDISSAMRYKILDRRHEELAVSFKMHSVYARPLEISNSEKDVQALSEILDLNKKNLLRDLRAERSFVWLGKHLPIEKTEEIQKRGLPGVYITNESQRYYPFHQRASHVVGFLKDGHGLAGVESHYDRLLRVSEEESGLEDSFNIQGHLVLTVDIRIQELIERQLGIVLGKVDAESAMGIIMRPSTGEILALASLPSYDPNIFWEYGAAERRNLVVNEMLHIGGMNRLFRLAAYYEENDRSLKSAGAQLNTIEDLKRSLKNGMSPVFSNEKDGYFTEQMGQKISSELYWTENFKLTALQEHKFKELIGLKRETVIDLPFVNNANDKVSGKNISKNNALKGKETTTAVSLVAALSKIINSSSTVAPHMAKAILGPKSGKMAKLRHEKSAHLLHETTGKVGRFLRKFAGENDGPVILESFLEIRKDDHEEMVREEDVQKIGEITTSISDIENRELAEKLRYQSVLFGYAPSDNPDLVMLVAFNDASVALDNKSPMRVMTEKNFRLIQDLAEDKEILVAGGKDQLHYAKIYQEWLHSQQSQEKRANINLDKSKELMPDLRGVSLRKALQIIQPLGIKVKVNGSGTVFSQSPKHGEKIHKGLCVIDLKEDRA